VGKYHKKWLTAEENLWEIANDLDDARHFSILPKGLVLRKADMLETIAGNLVEWNDKTGKMLKYK
jgi:hypothetical protein